MSSKKRIKKVINHKHSFEGGVQELLDRQNAFIKKVEEWQKGFLTEWADKFNALINDVGQFKRVVVMQFANNEVNSQIFAQAVDQMDTNILASAKVLRNIFGQLAQTDFYMTHPGQSPVSPPEVIDTEMLKQMAEATFKDAVKEAFAQVAAERKVHEEEQLRIKEKQAIEQAEADSALAKAAEIQAELLKAETPQIAPPILGGRGADIPEGAQVFRGD